MMERELMKETLEQIYKTADLHRTVMVAYDPAPLDQRGEGDVLFRKYQQLCANIDALIHRNRLGDKNFAKLFNATLNEFHELEVEYARLMAIKKACEEEKVTEIKNETKTVEQGKKKVTEFEISRASGQISLALKRGGAREGAGRKKSEYVIRKTSLALRPEHWNQIDAALDNRRKHNPKLTQSDLLREIFERAMSPFRTGDDMDRYVEE